MRNAFIAAVASLLTLSCFLVLEAQGGSRKKAVHRAEKPRVILAYAMQTPRVSSGCFPAKLRGILAHIAAHTGRRPVVTSGSRQRARRGSYHLKCLAADIRVPGVSVSTIVAAAQSAPGIGGVGTYCNGIVHVDVGPHRRWHHC